MSEDTQRIPGEEEVTDPHEFLNYFKPSQQEKPLIPPEEAFFFPVSFPTAVLSEHTQAEFYEQIARNWTYSGTADMRQTAAMIGGPDQWNVLVEDKDLKVRAQVAISASESYQSMLLYDPEPLVRRCLARYGTESIRIKLLNEGETDKEVLETIGTYAQDPNTISAVVRGADNLPEVLTSLMDRFNSDDLNRLAHHRNESVRVAAAMHGTSETCRTVLEGDLNTFNRQNLESQLSQLLEEERIQKQQKQDTLARSAMQTEKTIISSPKEWEQFLRFSARFYKYSFQEQIQIYAQRPNATACADVNTWVNRLHRHVVREENAIGLLAYDNEGLAVKYVFDVSDTDGATFPRLWEIRPEFVPAVISALAETNDITLLTLPETIEKSLKESIDNLIDAGNQLEYNQSRKFIKKSAAYIVNERCGLQTPTFSPDEFAFLEEAKTSELGNLICEASGSLLRQIEKIVKTAIRERREEHEHLQNGLQRGESGPSQWDHIRQERGLLDSETDGGSLGGGTTSGTLGNDENELPEGAQEGRVHREGAPREPVYPLSGSGETGGESHGNNDGAISAGSGGNGGTENEEPHEMGGADEQLQSPGRRNHQARTNLRITEFSSGMEQLSLFPAEEEQRNSISERELVVKASGSLSVSMEEFDRILRSGPVGASKNRIQEAVLRLQNKKELFAAVKQIYGIGGRTYDLLDGDLAFLNFGSKGIILRKHNEEAVFTWPTVTNRIQELVAKDTYLNEDERTDEVITEPSPRTPEQNQTASLELIQPVNPKQTPVGEWTPDNWRVQYHPLKAQHPDNLILIQVGDFIELYKEDAEQAAEILDCTLIRTRLGEDGYVSMCGFPLRRFEEYTTKLRAEHTITVNAVDKVTGGKGIVFATGTPVSNSMTELYTMQRYLQSRTLDEMGWSHFDAWAAQFTEQVTEAELAPEGTGYRERTRLAKFKNIPELMTVFREVADIKTADQLNLPTPQVEYITEVAQPTPEQQELVKELSERATAVHDKRVTPREDNMLKITSDGRKLGLDQRIINPNLPDNPESKLNLCVRNIIKEYQEGNEQKLTQLVFCDISTPQGTPGQGFTNVYEDIKKKLIAAKIPEKEIAFIHDATTEEKKKALFQKVRTGQVRILMGSTQKMGTGTNVQDRLIASHDLDCPWRPGDLEQRKGRIERQGNKNGRVHVYRYVTDGTFDSYLWQTVEKKQRFISQIMTSKTPSRTFEDTDSTAMSYAEIKALCAGSPLLKEKMELDTAVTKLQLLRNEHKSRKYQLENAIAQELPAEIARYKQHIRGYKEDISLRDSHPVPKEGFVGMELMGKVILDKKAAGEALLGMKAFTKPGEDVRIGSYRGFEMFIRLTDFESANKLILKGSLSHSMVMSDSEFGNLARIENILSSFEGSHEETKMRIFSLETELEKAKEDVDIPFPREEELKALQARLNELNVLVDLGSREYNGPDSSLHSFANRLYALTALYAPAELPEHSTPEQAKESLISCIKAGNSKAVEESIQKVLQGCPDSIKNEFDYLPEEATALITEYSKDPEQASEQRI